MLTVSALGGRHVALVDIVQSWKILPLLPLQRANHCLGGQIFIIHVQSHGDTSQPGSDFALPVFLNSFTSLFAELFALLHSFRELITDQFEEISTS